MKSPAGTTTILGQFGQSRNTSATLGSGNAVAGETGGDDCAGGGAAETASGGFGWAGPGVGAVVVVSRAFSQALNLSWYTPTTTSTAMSTPTTIPHRAYDTISG